MEIKEETTRSTRSVSLRFLKKKKTNALKRGSSSLNEKEAHSSTEFHEPLNFLIMILLGVLGVRFRGLGITPLVEHDVIMLFFIVAIVICGIAFLGMKLGPQNADYLYKFKFVCVICAILACELLASILVDPLRVLIINLCGIIVELIRRKYKQICEHLCHAANVVLNTSNNLFNKICLCQSICHILGWIQHTSKSFNKFTLFGGTKKQDQGDAGQVADMVLLAHLFGIAMLNSLSMMFSYPVIK